MEWGQSRIHLIFIICVVVVWLGPSAAYRSRPSTTAATDGARNKLEVRFQWKQIGFYDFPAASEFAFTFIVFTYRTDSSNRIDIVA